VLVLFALISMHGLQYLSVGPTSDRPASASPAHGMEVATDGSGADPVGRADGPVTTGADGGALAESRPLVGNMPGHGMPAHVWSLCLAVLLVAFAVLGAVYSLRSMTAQADGAAAVPRGSVRPSRPSRPPNLSALCVLRI
jgi:hypothetical protein